MYLFDFECENIEPLSFKSPYKSSSMKEVIDQIRRLKFDNSLVYVHGERGTEKNLIVSMILGRLASPNIIKVLHRGRESEKYDPNTVFLISKPEEKDFSFIRDSQLRFKCAVFVSDSDYEFLYLNKRIDEQKYEFLKRSERIYIPPLRDRKQDIVPIANFFLSEISLYLNQPKKELTKEAKESLIEYTWPENSMELKYRLTKACLLCKRKKISSKDIFDDYDDKFSIKNFLELKIGNLLSDFSNIENSNLYDTVIQEVEKALFSLVLTETGNNQLKASKILGINRNTLSKKLRVYNLF